MDRITKYACCVGVPTNTTGAPCVARDDWQQRPGQNCKEPLNRALLKLEPRALADTESDITEGYQPTDWIAYLISAVVPSEQASS